MIADSGLSKDSADESALRGRNSASAKMGPKNMFNNAQNAGIETIDRLLGTESRLFSTCSTLSSDSEGLKDYALGRGRDWVQRNGQLQHRAGGLPGEEPKEVLRLGLDDWDEIGRAHV